MSEITRECGQRAAMLIKQVLEGTECSFILIVAKSGDSNMFVMSDVPTKAAREILADTLELMGDKETFKISFARRAPQVDISCSACGLSLALTGAAVCGTCDPDLEAVVDGEAESKTPYLCDDCFCRHVADHGEKQD